MLHIGCHLSSSMGYTRMGRNAVEIGADTFQFFTRNPRGGRAKEIDTDDIASFLSLARENKFAPIVAHAPYTLNPCSADERTREFAFEVLTDDLRRMEYTPGNYYNFHPGSHTGQGVDAGIEIISGMLDEVLRPEQTTTVLLETMSGKGSEVGGTFEDLRRIIDKVSLGDKLGVCLDACHVYNAGYDIVNDLDFVIAEFDRIIGLHRLHAIHLNDSRDPYASHKDRHEKIGHGSIGLDTITNIINHPRLRHLLFVLETPNELDGHAEEIRLLRGLYREQ